MQANTAILHPIGSPHRAIASAYVARNDLSPWVSCECLDEERAMRVIIFNAQRENTMSRICTFPMAWSKAQSSLMPLSCPSISSLSSPRVFLHVPLVVLLYNPAINTSEWRQCAMNALRASLIGAMLLGTQKNFMGRKRDVQYMGVYGPRKERLSLKGTWLENTTGVSLSVPSYSSKQH